MLSIFILLSYTVSKMSHTRVHSGASAGKPLRPIKPSGLTSLAMLVRVFSDAMFRMWYMSISFLYRIRRSDARGIFKTRLRLGPRSTSSSDADSSDDMKSRFNISSKRRRFGLGRSIFSAAFLL